MIKTGDKFGKLIALEVVGKAKNRNLIWKCKCDCGNIINVCSTSLSSGNTKSCGCLKKESAVKRGISSRILNKYDLSGEYGVGFATNGEQFYFDKEDYELIKNYTWSINDSGYVVSNPLGKWIRMHILIMNRIDANDEKDIDHINHNQKDNRKENLRIIEHFQNITYCKTYLNNTSGRKGVYWDKSKNRWVVYITYNKKTHFIGRYENFEDAVKAREEAEQKIHGEFHYLE